MTLSSALQVGRSALTASQAALQVAGNNMANAATEGFHRRSVHLAPVRGEIVGRGHLVGRGVQIESIRRDIDEALQARYRDAVGDENAAGIAERFLTSIEALQNELSDNDLSSLLSEFFNSFSELANSPSDAAVRSVVTQQGVRLSGRIADLRQDYAEVLGQVDEQLGVTVKTVNDLLDRIADLNREIVLSETGIGEAAALRDQRDLLIDELAEHIDVTVLEHGSGSVDILVNSIPIILAGASRGIELRKETVGGVLEVTLRVAEDGTHLDATTGTIGGLLDQRENGAVTPSLNALDAFASQLIYQVNRLHAQGQGQHGFEDATGTTLVADTTATLNTAAAGLPFSVENGSVFLHVTHQDTGERKTYQINVDGDTMSLDDLIAEINTVVAVPNVTAGLSVENAFTLTADPGYEFSFSDDTSGILTALGVNTFFTGESARTIDVNQVILDDPSLLAVGGRHVPGSNDTALALASLQDVPVDALNGLSLRGFWQDTVTDLSVKTGTARAAAESSALVRESLFSQIQGVSGVSLDEESINLLTFQRQFQAAARFISVIDETLQILISLA
jgi:flagellar hook-associated protein 1 FlgK